MKTISSILTALDQVQRRLTWLPPLVARLITGWIFLWSGWGKLNNLDGVIEYFTELGIPAAGVQAPFIATLELVGGTLLIVGLGTRFFSFMLSCTMLVALMTALREDIETLGDLFGTSEFLYIALFIVLMVQGGGMMSLDYLLRRRIATTVTSTE